MGIEYLLSEYEVLLSEDGYKEDDEEEEYEKGVGDAGFNCLRCIVCSISQVSQLNPVRKNLMDACGGGLHFRPGGMSSFAKGLGKHKIIIIRDERLTWNQKIPWQLASLPTWKAFVWVLERERD